jgi:hypothetical protein
MQDNAPKTVEHVLLAIKDQDADVQTALMKSLFGSESIGSIAPLLQNLDNFRKAFKLVEKDTNFSGSMQTEFEKQTATANFKINKFMATAAGLATTLGNTLLPPLAAVLDVVTPVLEGVTEAATEFDGLAAAIVGIPALLIAAKSAFLVFKAGKLLVGQGKNYADLGKAKLGIGLDGTANSAKNATSRISRLNQTLDNLGNKGGRGQSRYRREGASTSSRRKSRSKRARLSRRGGRFGRLLDLGSRLTDFLPMGGMAAPAMAAAPSKGMGKGSWGKRAAVLGGGTALSMLTASANATDLALMGADAATMAGDVTSALPLKGMMAGMVGTAGKLFKPLNIMLQGAALTSAINNGSAEEIGGTAGDMAGGLGGAALGATIGTAILPGIGTVVGGALGGLAGGELGDWLGTKVARLFSSDEEETLTAKAATLDKEKDGLTQPANTLLDSPDGASSLAMLPEPKSVLPSPDNIAKSLTQSTQDNRKIEFNLNIPQSSGNSQQDEDMLNRLVAKLKDMMMAEGMMGSGSLAVTMDGSLSDRSDV